MLSKEVCKRCWELFHNSRITVGWLPTDDDHWETKNHVHCPYFEEDPDYNHKRQDDRYPIASIPIVCKRVFEHAVATGMTKHESM